MRIRETIKNDVVVYSSDRDGFKREYRSLLLLLRGQFHDHGEFYCDVFGISYKDAEMAKWHTYHNEFSKVCAGWKRFLDSEGKIVKWVSIDYIDIREILFGGE